MKKRLSPMAEAIREAYARGEEDEQILPRVLVDADGNPIGSVKDGDPVIFFDIRGEREIELTEAFTDPEFRHFDTGGRVARFTTMIEYHSKLNTAVIFPPEGEIVGSLCEAITRSGLKIVKIAESEKMIHLSYFLNGKREQSFPGESRIVVSSPKDVSNYHEKPEMSAREVADHARDQIAGDADVIIVNFANVDVVGHIEDKGAILTAVETVDRELGRVLSAAREAGVPAIVTADHGTVEKWLYPDGKVDTGHTDSPVPFALVWDGADGVNLRSHGTLIDVAPTILDLLGIDKPEQMTGSSLVESGDLFGKARRLVIVILDGWGYREDEHGNLIALAKTPIMDEIAATRPFTTLKASGEAVGMPKGKVGNSESGHLHIGAGRVILSDRVKIDRAIEDGSFFKNEAVIEAFAIAKREKRPLHLLGIISFYSSHGSVDHLYALLRMAKQYQVEPVYIHGLLGRRGERPEAGARYVDDVETFCRELGVGRVVSIMGRFWALDREENWDRVEVAYRAIADGEGVKVKDA